VRQPCRDATLNRRLIQNPCQDSVNHLTSHEPSPATHPTIRVRIERWCQERFDREKFSSTQQLPSWLTERELDELSIWRAPGRRRDWLIGRYVAKMALIHWLEEPTLGMQEIQILSRSSDRSKGIAPRVTIRQSSLSAGFSLSHADGMIAVAFIPTPHCRLGIDLVSWQPLSRSFLRSWFSPAEQQALSRADEREPLRYWAAKEAAFKAFPPGPFDPRAIQLEPRDTPPRESRPFPEYLHFLARTTRETPTTSAPVIVASHPIGQLTWGLAWYSWDGSRDGSREMESPPRPFPEIKLESIGFPTAD
jgi:4'-phosphopantetheinyl transferase EntD